jgi:hypothetical protein
MKRESFVNVFHTIAAGMVTQGITSGYVMEREDKNTGRIKRSIINSCDGEVYLASHNPTLINGVVESLTYMTLDFVKWHIQNDFKFCCTDDGNKFAMDVPLSQLPMDISDIIEFESEIYIKYPPSIARFICDELNPPAKNVNINLLESSETFEFELYYRSKPINGYITRERKWNGEIEVNVDFDDTNKLNDEDKKYLTNHLKSKI